MGERMVSMESDWDQLEKTPKLVDSKTDGVISINDNYYVIILFSPATFTIFIT